uniref:Uncharacterized protein n=1 Tax=Dunaliella tertiolecta TaxID=3047 RepID=A0A7S3R9C4_DUNTE|eukprot:759966-Pelagomonas_calceolata.AAC.1
MADAAILEQTPGRFGLKLTNVNHANHVLEQLQRMTSWCNLPEPKSTDKQKTTTRYINYLLEQRQCSPKRARLKFEVVQRSKLQGSNKYKPHSTFMSLRLGNSTMSHAAYNVGLLYYEPLPL